MAQERIPKTLEERTVRFSKKDLVRMNRVPCLNLDDLDETAAYQFPDSDEYMLIECEPKWAEENHLVKEIGLENGYANRTFRYVLYLTGQAEYDKLNI